MRYDAVVIGAGPSGSMAAFEISRAGFKAALLEKHNRPGVPLCCGEAVSAGAIKKIMDVEPQWISSVINKILVVSPGGKRAAVQHSEAGYVLDRETFDFDLAKRAEAAGADLLTETIGLELKGDKSFHTVTIVSRDEIKKEIEASIFIAADGIESKIARLAGVPNLLTLREIDSSLQFRVGGISIDPHTIEFHVGREIAPSNYLWIFPKSATVANVGLGLSMAQHKGSQAEVYLKRFLAGRFGQYTILSRHCGLVPRYQGTQVFRKKNLLVVGDAARAIDSLSGAGIAYAMLSGKYAGLASVEYLKGKVGSIEEIDRLYPGQFLDEKKEELQLHNKLRNIYNKLEDDDFDEIVSALGDFFAPERKVEGLKAGSILAGLIATRPKLLKYVRHLL